MLRVIEDLLQQEREACAKIAEAYGDLMPRRLDSYDSGREEAAYAIAAKIRARP